jgi:hypothetical protein
MSRPGLAFAHRAVAGPPGERAAPGFDRRDEAPPARDRQAPRMRFAFEVSGTAVELAPTNGHGPRAIVKSYNIVGCSPSSARDTASQLFLADLATAGLRPAGDVTVVASS